MSLDDSVKCLKSDDDEISIRDMLNFLMNPPFEVADQKQALLYARYLIENNNKNFIEFDYKNSNSIIMIRSIFKNSMNNYKIYSPEESFLLDVEVSAVFKKYKTNLLDMILQESQSTELATF